MSNRQSSAIDRALELVRAGKTAYAAAKLTGTSQSAVWRACKRHGISLAHNRIRAVQPR